MTYFAKVEPTDDPMLFTVVDNIRITQDILDTGHWGDPVQWILNDYNTYGNVHYAPSPPAEPMTPDGGTPIRANFAGIGFTFDLNYSIGDYEGVFYEPKPTIPGNWVLNTTTFLWEDVPV